MPKTILVTGSTDGIGLETARVLLSQGHRVLLHGRNPQKLADAEASLSAIPRAGHIESYLADLSKLAEVVTLAKAVSARHDRLDVLINNAGIFRTASPVTRDGLDVRFVVNTLAPYLLTQRLFSLLGDSGRVINLSSAAQASVNPEALAGNTRLTDDFATYAQSKLALTMWSRSMGLALKDKGPAIIAVNPGSLLGSKMVKEGFGVAGGDIGIGADILTQAALSKDFADASGRYFDNDAGRFASPHADALDDRKLTDMVSLIDMLIAKHTPA
ncbi:SDR family NAD(P)-dependent oxidoreductase [Oceanimonas sp. MB9]|uniref:SDR family NAD(P)-dependent oxidoreductase n=1 Tax=Oceanimonas sp. MB9 TaxID=2588453 RepID=UPI0013F6591F|nr:SDR family NAD(P)-dependent oxidoreductase [Oceanimonas sp. MB9]NHI00710.1 Rhamnolipids biosynthesis 3-oxoacyl-[acyl-carrier-protein] reductase [Oceanimonas sp. MB9]